MSNEQTISGRLDPVFKYVLISIITLLITKHVFDLSSFVQTYNFSYDFGEMLKNVCNDEYFEVESHRMQIAQNEKDMREKMRQKSIFNTFVVIILLLLSVPFSGLLASTCVNLFYNERFINEMLGKTLSPSSDGFAKLFRFLLPTTIIDVISIVLKLAINGEMFLSFYILTSTFLIIYLTIIYPLTHWISLNGWDNLDKVFNINPIFILTGIILCRLVYFFISSKSNSTFSRYFNENKAFNEENVFSFIQFLVIIYAYMFVFKGIQTLSKYDEQTEKYQNVSFLDYMKTVWGLKSGSNLSDFISSTIIILVVIQCVISFVPENHLTNTLSNYIFKPIMAILLISVVINSMIEYNKIISTEIITNPINLYKRHLNTVNTEFNSVLEYESKKYIDDASTMNICPNVANAILSTLYSDLFKDVERLSSNSSVPDGSPITIIPSFQYSKICTKDPTNYNNDISYNFLYLIGQKGDKNNIFYDSGKCDSENTPVVKKIKMNIKNIDSVVIKNKLRIACQNVLNNRLYYDHSRPFIIGRGDDVNNKLVDILNIQDIKDKVDIYDTIIDNVVKEYVKCKSFDDKNTIGELITFLSSVFSQINEILSEIRISRRGAKITNYVISNYNNIHSDDMYKNNNLIEVPFKTIQTFDLTKVEELLENSVKICEFVKDKSQDDIKLKLDAYILHVNDIDRTVKSPLFQNKIKLNSNNSYSYKEMKEMLDKVKLWIDDSVTNKRPTNEIINLLINIADIQFSIDEYKRSNRDSIETNMDKKDSILLSEMSTQSDRMVYLVVANYIIILTLTYFII